MIEINGKVYKGNNLSMINGKVFIDGKEIEGSEDKKVININVEGNLETLEVDRCTELKVTGDVKNFSAKNGNVQITGNVTGDVTNKNGNITCGNVGGDVDSKNGNISYTKLYKI